MEIDLIFTIVSGFLILLGIRFALVGIMQWQNVRHFVQTAEQAEGTVIELVERRRSKGITYSPVVEFTDHFGQRHEHRSSTGSNPPSHSVGDKVQILYDRNDCGSTKINHWTHLYLNTVFSFFFAVNSIVGGIVAFIVTRSN
jgi:hypothetical protein